MREGGGRRGRGRAHRSASRRSCAPALWRTGRRARFRISGMTSFFSDSSDSPSPNKQPTASRSLAQDHGLGPPLRVTHIGTSMQARARQAVLGSSTSSSVASSPAVPAECSAAAAASAAASAGSIGGFRHVTAATTTVESPMAPSTCSSSSMLTPPSQRGLARLSKALPVTATASSSASFAATGGGNSGDAFSFARRLAAATPLSASSSSSFVSSSHPGWTSCGTGCSAAAAARSELRRPCQWTIRASRRC